MSTKLKVLSFNMWGLPPPFSPNLKQRFRQTMLFIKDQNPDIVCLQECWIYYHLRKLKKFFPDYYFLTSGKGSIYNQSGLVIMTKFKPLLKRFFMYDRPISKRVDEFISGKGILVTKLVINNKKFFLMNTHTFARATKKGEKFLFKQLRKLKRFLEKHSDIIFVGDLNITPKEFKKWNASFFKTQIPKQPELFHSNPYRKKVVLHYLNTGDTVSYICTKLNPLKNKIKTKVITDVYLSDHQPLVSEIELT